MPDRIRPERIIEGLKTPKDIWRECKDLPPGEWLPRLFWLTDDTGKPIKVEVKVGRKTHESNLVFVFRISPNERFEAHEARATTEDDFEISDSYPYHGLAKTMREKYGAAGFVEATKELPSTEAAPDDLPPWEGPDQFQFARERSLGHAAPSIPEEAPPERPRVPSGVYRAMGSTRERLAAHGERASQKYWEDIRRIRSKRDFRWKWHERFDKYELPERIKALPESRAKDGLILVRSRMLRRGAEPEHAGNIENAMVETLTIRLLQKKQLLEAGRDVMDLLPLQKVALATLVEAVENIEKEDSSFRKSLIAAGIEQIRLEAVVWYEEAGETHDLHVPIAFGNVPSA